MAGVAWSYCARVIDASPRQLADCMSLCGAQGHGSPTENDSFYCGASSGDGDGELRRGDRGVSHVYHTMPRAGA
jgi:hypothetical protein